MPLKFKNHNISSQLKKTSHRTRPDNKLLLMLFLTVLELGAPLSSFLEEVLYKSLNEC